MSGAPASEAPLGCCSTAGGHLHRGYDEIVQWRRESHQPVAAVGILGEADDDVAVMAILDQRAVGMEVLPGAGLAVDPHARSALQALDKLVLDAGIRQRLLHHFIEPWAEERVAREQVVEPGDL